MAAAAPDANAPVAGRSDGSPRFVQLSDESLPELVGRLVDDTRGLISAEVELQKAKLSERVSAYKTAAIFFAAAGVLGLCALIALLVGLIMTLATLIGPGFATLVVVLAVLTAAGVLGMLGAGKLAKPKTGAPR